MEKKKYFISYTTRTEEDRQWAIWVEWFLRVQLGHDTIMQEYDFQPGDNFIERMDDALKKADCVIGILTHTYMQSAYCKDEWTNADRFIPVRFDNCNPQGLLKNRVYINLYKLDSASAKKELAAKLKISTRPTEEPLFPASSEPVYSQIAPEPSKPQKPVLTPRMPDESLNVLNDNNTNVSARPTVGSIIKVAGIDWRVLDVDGSKALLISDKILETRPYNVKNEATTWEQCTLRKYLNGEFYNKLGVAKGAIAETLNLNPNNPWYGTSGCSTTIDKVFLLSLGELVKYFGDSGDLQNKRRKDGSGNLKSDGYLLDDQYSLARIARDGNGGASWWWLRSPGRSSGSAAGVSTGGRVGVYGDDVSLDFGGVRPALWLNL